MMRYSAFAGSRSASRSGPFSRGWAAYIGWAFCLLLGFAVLAAPTFAQGTRRDITNIRDELFGLSETHLFVLRTTSDNLGLYQTNRVETFLVAIDLATLAEEYWPVYRGLQTTDYNKNGEEFSTVVRADAPGKAALPSATPLADPFAILAERGGIPSGGFEIELDTAPEEQVMEIEGDFIIYHPDRPPLRLTRAELSTRFAASTAAIATQVINYPRMSSVQTKTLFAERTIRAESCTAGGVWQPFYPFSRKIITAVRFTCRDEEGGIIALVQLFPTILDTRARDTGGK